MINFLKNWRKEKMKIDKRLSINVLSNQVLQAMIRRTAIVLQQLEQKDVVEYYEGKYFTWNLAEDEPTLTIDFNKDVVHIWWNKETLDENIQVHSDIKQDACKNLAYYVGLENVLYSELEELAKDIKPKQLDIEEVFAEELDYE